MDHSYYSNVNCDLKSMVEVQIAERFEDDFKEETNVHNNLKTDQSEDSEDVSEYDNKDEIDVDNIKTEHSEDECANVGPETFEDRKRDPLKLEPDGDISNSISASALKRSRREVEVNQIENPHNNWHKIDYNISR